MKSDMQLPKYFNLLSSEDQKSYLELHSYLSSKEYRNNRGRRLTKFSEILNAIQQFCIKNDENDVTRCMVCGVCWLPPKGIAINIRQLHILLDKCKSSINGSLQRMGYNPLPPKNDLVNQLIELIPSLKNNFSELREWTIRTLTILTPQPEPVSMNPAYIFQNTPQFSNVQNNLNPKINNENEYYNNKYLNSSISANSLSDIQNNVNRNYYSSFSSPQPNIFVNQFMVPQESETNTFVPQSTVPSLTQPVEHYNEHNNTDVSNVEIDSNYFDDPFCLPPSSLFDEDNDFGCNSEYPFDAWSNEGQ